MIERVRVSADPPGRGDRPRTETELMRTVTVDGRAVAEPEAVYVRGLVRAQLRLALGCVLGFLVTAGALGVLLATVPGLSDVVIGGVPLPWLVHAFGFYPIIFVFALIYAAAARRNERRYRALRDNPR